VRRGAKRRYTIFHARAGLLRFPYKFDGTCYVQPVFLHMVGYAVHVVHSGAFEHETSTHYFSSSGDPGAVFIKSAPGHVTQNLCFCNRWDLRVT
jgi:hypothetical protein